MAELGRFAILVAVLSAAWGALSAFIGATSGRDEPTRSAEGAVKASALALSVAGVALFASFLTRDFSLEYVAEYSSRSLSLFYTLGAFWAGQPGSLLLWAWVLSIYGAVVVRQNRARNRELMPWVILVLSLVLVLFSSLVAFTSNPFKHVAVPVSDGQGLNPLLQNYGQWFHPLTLYAGYVGFTVPFAFCIAALVTGKLDDQWIRTVRKWTLWAWMLLTAGIVFGARWAYVELGWGGFWGWDPVENASLLPWLTATAYLHSVMIQERRGMLKVWNVSLISATFTLSLLGTFLTRSGVISSVHAFASSSIGPFLMAAVMLTVLASGALIVWRLPHLASKGSLDSPISRESSFLLNNLLLVGIAFTVLWGTVFPLVAEAVRGVKVSVGPPFFQGVVTPMAVALLALIGFCPLLAWRKASTRNLRRNFVIPVAGGLVSFAAVVLATRGGHRGLVLILALAVFVTVTIAAEFFRGARARRAIRGERWGPALARLFSKNPRRYGGYLIHFGVVVLLVGIAVNTAYKKETRATLQVGQSTQVGGYVLSLRGLSSNETTDRFTVTATFGIARTSGGRSLGTVKSSRTVYASQDQPGTEVGIRSTPAEDLYVILESGDPAQRVGSFALLVNPGVFWIWFGALIVLAGGVVVGWPSRPGKREGVSDASRRIEAAVPA